MSVCWFVTGTSVGCEKGLTSCRFFIAAAGSKIDGKIDGATQEYLSYIISLKPLKTLQGQARVILMALYPLGMGFSHLEKAQEYNKFDQKRL